eukprot:372835-Hanusia_phi.AAC.2
MYPIPVKAETQGDTDRTIAKWLKTKKREDVLPGVGDQGGGVLRSDHVAARCVSRTTDQVVIPCARTRWERQPSDTKGDLDKVRMTGLDKAADRHAALTRA